MQFEKFEELKDLLPYQSTNAAKPFCKSNNLNKYGDINLLNVNNDICLIPLLSLPNTEIIKQEEEWKTRHKLLKKIRQLIKEIESNALCSIGIEKSLSKLKSLCLVKTKDKLKDILHIYKNLSDEYKKFKKSKDLLTDQKNINRESNFISKNRLKENQKLLLTPDKKIPFTFPNVSLRDESLSKIQKFGKLKLLKFHSHKRAFRHPNDKNNNINKKNQTQLFNFVLKATFSNNQNDERLTKVEFPQIRNENLKEANQICQDTEKMTSSNIDEISLTKTNNYKKEIERENNNNNLKSQNNDLEKKSIKNSRASIKIYIPKIENIDSTRDSIISKNISNDFINFQTVNPKLLKNKGHTHFFANGQFYNSNKRNKRNIVAHNNIPNLKEENTSKNSKIEGWIECNSSQSSINL